MVHCESNQSAGTIVLYRLMPYRFGQALVRLRCAFVIHGYTALGRLNEVLVLKEDLLWCNPAEIENKEEHQLCAILQFANRICSWPAKHLRQAIAVVH